MKKIIKIIILTITCIVILPFFCSYYLLNDSKLPKSVNISLYLLGLIGLIAVLAYFEVHFFITFWAAMIYALAPGIGPDIKTEMTIKGKYKSGLPWMD